MADINTKAPVLVTGATGYVAGVLIKKLLESGLTVHAAVRDTSPDKLKYLNKLADTCSGEIKYSSTDLMQAGSYQEAMQGCELVFHTASPFKLDATDPQIELLEPALSGTQNVLQQANSISSVKRIVLTSSVAAIYGDNCDLNKTENHCFTEAHWNNSSSIDHQAYAYSKTLAEQEAWEIQKQQKQWDLVVINPSLVIGPGINPNASSESFNLVRAMGDGTLKFGVPRWGMGVVDVRDLAQAHFNAGFMPSAKGRYIINGHNTDLFSLTQTLKNKYGKQYAIPTRVMPKALIWLFGPFIDKKMTRKIVARNANFSWIADSSKSINELNMVYRPLAISMVEFFQQLIEHKRLK